MDPGVVVAIVTVGVIVAAVLVQGVTSWALNGWRERLRPLDEALLAGGPGGHASDEVRDELRRLMEMNSWRRRQNGARRGNP